MRKLDRCSIVSEVRNMCIKYRLYTCGDCEEYSNMFDTLVDNYMDNDILVRTANDIYYHSDIDIRISLASIQLKLARIFTSCLYDEQ